jgi:hypothetical protein
MQPAFFPGYAEKKAASASPEAAFYKSAAVAA